MPTQPGWTFETLEVHLSSKIKAVQDSVVLALAASTTAVTKAENAVEKRFDSVNEFRKTLSDQTATFVPRNEYQVQHDALVEIVSALSNRVNKIETQGVTRSEGLGLVGSVILGVFSVISAIAIVLGAVAAFVK